MEKKSKSELTSKKKTLGRSDVPNDINTLQAEIARLKNELKQEKLRADTYDLMIDIAESRFNIPIRKKAGAKR